MPETTVGIVRPQVKQNLPEVGKFTAAEWAKIFDIEVKTLVGNLKKYGIRTLIFGNTTVIVAEWFWEDLQK